MRTYNGANGHAKKDEEAPPVKEAPEAISNFFDGMIRALTSRCLTVDTQFSDMHIQFKTVLDRKRLPSEALHLITLTQEVYTFELADV